MVYSCLIRVWYRCYRIYRNNRNNRIYRRIYALLLFEASFYFLGVGAGYLYLYRCGGGHFLVGDVECGSVVLFPSTVELQPLDLHFVDVAYLLGEFGECTCWVVDIYVPYSLEVHFHSVYSDVGPAFLTEFGSCIEVGVEQHHVHQTMVSSCGYKPALVELYVEGCVSIVGGPYPQWYGVDELTVVEEYFAVH